MSRAKLVIVPLVACAAIVAAATIGQAAIGDEVAISRHLPDGQEYTVSLQKLLRHGKALFAAVWTDQEGGGRPLTKGTGAPVADPGSPLDFPRNFNRLSAPDANSCAGCHNAPRIGGGGDIVANVFVLGHRFDFATFDLADNTPTRGAVDELGDPVQLQTIANSRNTLGMFGSGYIELLATEMTADLQTIRDSIAPGGSAPLVTKGVSFGVLARDGGGNWDTSSVEGLPAPSLSASPPSLIINPFHQAGAVISVRQFSNNAFNHHHGIQTQERFGVGVDADGDGFVNEMTRADVTASSVWQAQLPPPGRIIPANPEIEAAVQVGEQRFAEIGCTDCHRATLPLYDWDFVEPNPYNPAGNLRPGDAPDFVVSLTHPMLDTPRLQPVDGVIHVAAFTDLKLHDITTGAGDPNREPLNMHHPAGSAEFFAGNSRFLTKKLWGIANEPPFFHHGQYPTMRLAIEAHHGEAEAHNLAWTGLSSYEQGAIIEFLKTLQVLPPGATATVLDENLRPRSWDSPLMGSQ